MKEITQDTFEEEVLRASGLVLVDFYSVGCAPCRHLIPELEKLAQLMPGGLRIYTINVDDAFDLAASLRVSSLPACFLFQDGHCIGQRGGGTARELHRWITESLQA